MSKKLVDWTQIHLGPGKVWNPPNDPPILLPGNGVDRSNEHLVALAVHLGRHADKLKVAVVTNKERSLLVSTLAAYVPEVSTVPQTAAFEFLDGLLRVPVTTRGPYVVFLDDGAGKALSEGAEEAVRMDHYLRIARSYGIHVVFVGYPHVRALDFRY